MLDTKTYTANEIFAELQKLDATGRAALYASLATGAARFLDADDVAGYVALEPEEKRELAEAIAEAGRRFFVEGDHEDQSPDNLVIFAQRDVDGDWRAAFSYSEDEDMTRIETGLAAVVLLLDPEKAASVVLDSWDEEWDD